MCYHIVYSDATVGEQFVLLGWAVLMFSSKSVDSSVIEEDVKYFFGLVNR
jgi:hypothetical protein